MMEQILKRLDAIEKRLDELDERTIGQIRLGPVKAHVRQMPDAEINKIVEASRRALDSSAQLSAEAAAIKRADEISTPFPPVDKGARVLTSGASEKEKPDYRDLKDNGQQKDYVVLTEAERLRGFVRPVRRSYVHQKCGTLTTMSLAIAETYARDPQFYSGTFCCGCGKHFPVGANGEFVWDGTEEKVGT